MSRHPASAQSSNSDESIPKPDFSVGCDDAVAVSNLEVVACKEKEIFVDNVKDCDCMRKASQEIRELQMGDNDLLPYFQYLEEGKLPTCEQDARKIVMESEKLEVLDGVLHHDNAANPLQWCIAVPKDLRQMLLSEAHAGLYSGHLSERKIYDRLRRHYWWHGMQADVRRFCRGCLRCVSRRGPGRAVRPHLHPVPVLKPFHQVAVDVLTLPLTSRGNKYVVVFMDYFTKWVEAFAVSDQQAQTIARLLVENIVCRRGVLQELLSDRGSNFLSYLILEMCSILGIQRSIQVGITPHGRFVSIDRVHV